MRPREHYRALYSLTRLLQGPLASPLALTLWVGPIFCLSWDPFFPTFITYFTIFWITLSVHFLVTFWIPFGSHFGTHFGLIWAQGEPR